MTAQVSESDLVQVTTRDLSDFLSQVNAALSSTVFDLCGGEIRFSGGADEQLAITKSGITIRNGTIWLASGAEQDGPILHISSKQLTLMNVVITGGRRGLSLTSGSSVILSDCSMTHQWYGLSVGEATDAANQATLIACGLKLSGFVDIGLAVFGGSVNLTDSVLDSSNCTGIGVTVNGKGSAFRSANMRCFNNHNGGLLCSMGGKAFLVDCSFYANAIYDVYVLGKGSCVTLTACDLSKEPSVSKGGKISYISKVSSCELGAAC